MCRTLIILLVFSFCFHASAQEEDKQPLNIVVISGFNPVLPWSQLMIQGIGKAVSKQDRPINIFVESVYAELNEGEAQMQRYLDSMSVQHAGRNIDAIIGDSVNTFQFLQLIEKSERFSNARIIYFDAMERYQNIQKSEKSYIAPVTDTIQNQVEFIFSALPKLRKLHVSHSSNNIFETHFSAIKNHMARHKIDMPLVVWDISNPAEFSAMLADMQEGDAFVYLPVLQQDQGTRISPLAYLRQIANDIPVPIFSFWEAFLGEGIVGGYLYRPSLLGEALIERALHHDHQKNMPIAQWMFDGSELARFDLTPQELNKDAVIVNPVTNILIDYPVQLATIVVVFLSVLLLVSTRRASKLRKTSERLAAVTAKARNAEKEAISASNAKSKFLATISHEIRNPINGIVGVFDLLSKTSLSQQQQKLIDMGQFSTQNLLHTVNDILDFSKLNSRKFTLNDAPFSMRKLLHDLHGYAKYANTNQDVKIITDFDSMVDVPLVGDANRIKQTLINLLNNSLKFTNQGSITIHGAIKKQANKYALRCSIADTGIGISEADQAELFQPFKQAENELTKAGKGSGLGLSICKELVTLMGGNIHASSRIGEGTRVTIDLLLPRAPIESLAPIAPEDLISDTQTASSNPIHVLLVEDSEINQQIITAQLKQAGIDCSVCEHGLAGIQFLLQTQCEIDLVLMDIQMPVMNGYDAARKIRQGETGTAHKDIPIIALTAHTSLNEDERAKQAQFNRYMYKPIQANALIEQIQALVTKA